MTFTHALSTNNYGPAKFIVSSSAANGTHTTIQAAITAASSGDTVFIRDGTYTEDLTLKAGVSLSAFSGNGFVSTVTIIGKAAFTAAGTCGISNIRLQTNSDFCVAVTGSAASILYINNCYFNCTNNTGISFTSSSASSIIYVNSCEGDVGTTGISWFAFSGAGTLNSRSNNIFNSGNSLTASTISGTGTFNDSASNYSIIFSHSSSSGGGYYRTFFNTTVTNTTPITTAGTSAVILNQAILGSGTASCVSIGAGTTAKVALCILGSSNTNVLTGAGTLNYGGIVFTGSSSGHNVTTETPYATLN